MAIALGRADATGKLPEADVIERAARLLAHAPGAGAEPAAEPAPIALDEMSAGLLDARFDVIEREAGLLLRGERALMQGARTLLGRPTSCVGRDWELGALSGLLDECIDERTARVVVVTAAAGMGKSRLGAELVSRVRERDDAVAIWIGRGAAARGALAAARDRLVAIAGRIADPAYRQSFLEAVPENARTLAFAHAWLGDAAPST
ncbi:MAG TPA: AAA family ATPase [Kofleriaceae bacterium]|nr:AAA family ATPase [Kofleriaceae bacterium]